MDLVTLFRDVAFPVAITAYLLISITPRLEGLRTDSVRVLGALALVLMALDKKEEAMQLLKEGAGGKR